MPSWLTVIDRMAAEANIEATAPGSTAPRAAARRAPAPRAGAPSGGGSPEDDRSPAAVVVRKLLQLAPDADLGHAGLGVTPGWDSLKHIELLVTLESALGIRFGSGEMEALHRFSELDSLCRQKIAERGAR
jgi:hypothetical protein